MVKCKYKWRTIFDKHQMVLVEVLWCGRSLGEESSECTQSAFDTVNVCEYGSTGVIVRISFFGGSRTMSVFRLILVALFRRKILVRIALVKRVVISLFHYWYT